MSTETDTEFTFTDSSVEEEAADANPDVSGLTLDDNVVQNLIEYSRSKTAKNEQQFVLATLSYLSGFMENPSHFNSAVLIGTAGSGKSHIQNTIEDLFPDDFLYKATSGTDKSIIYDTALEEAYYMSMDELNKPSEEVIEIMKSLHGGEDEEFRYKITGDGRGADRDVDEIVRSATPYCFLYAQYEPDFEMWDRLLKIPVHESRQKNDGVARMQWDHSHIQFSDDDTVEYKFDYSDGETALREHIRSMPKDAWVKIPAGEDEYGWDAYEHVRSIFDIERSETNRVAAMVANLVRASALLNYENREQRKIHVENEGEKYAFIAEPQDVANVMACRDVLLATTHQIDRKRRAVCVAIEENGGPINAAPISSPPQSDEPSIMDYLRKTDASFVKRDQIEAILSDLQDNYLVDKLENAGNNGRHLYQFNSWHQLGKFEITDEFKRVFGDCHDPFTDSNFIDAARRINAELQPSASDFMSDASVETNSDKSGQETLDGSSKDVSLDPHEHVVRDLLAENLDGERIENLQEHDPTVEEMLGFIEIGDNTDDFDKSGTIFDPAHPAWESGPEDWVNDEADAYEAVEQAIRTLTTKGVFVTSTVRNTNGQPTAMDVTVHEV